MFRCQTRETIHVHNIAEENRDTELVFDRSDFVSTRPQVIGHWEFSVSRTFRPLTWHRLRQSPTSDRILPLTTLLASNSSQAVRTSGIWL
ncbi:hypothetical protein J6590_062545 [Homalodisca vitripennis]|nr:hypothetical protein J6590_062545 [Homalodisca vitripennis]